MRVYFITVRSVTFGQRAESFLRKNGIGVSLQRTPRSMAKQGCGYCLRVRYSDAPRCVQLFREHNIGFQKVYLQLNETAAEELEL